MSRLPKISKLGIGAHATPIESEPDDSSVHENETKRKIKTIDTETAEPLLESIAKRRMALYESVAAFPFNKKRVRVLSTVTEMSDGAILYWMTREQRVQDNWSLLYAQKLALKQRVPLLVAFCLIAKPFLGATLRHYHFMLEGLKETEKELRTLNIPFFLLHGDAQDEIPAFVRRYDVGGVVCDFSPLRIALGWVKSLTEGLPASVPLAQVDAHNIVPVWHASDKLEYAARTIRNKINSKLDEFLTEYPPVVSHSHKVPNEVPQVDWSSVYDKLQCDRDVAPVAWAKPGYTAGIKVCEQFISKRLGHFADDRNDPNKLACSQLSPWYHFGQVSVQRCILEIKRHASRHSKSVSSYMEEAIVRRELADNFCFYQPNYDNLDGANEWAKKTLNDHRKDKREHLYSLEQLDNGQTHDILWNAAQKQMRVEGKMHGFLRMYWAKKILEWTESPEQALHFAIHLNDRYELDGREPSGYVGCMWSICGIHDQGWAERPIFGKIRYMNFEGCKRKFDINTFIAKYSK